jgi:hypothetical protein
VLVVTILVVAAAAAAVVAVVGTLVWVAVVAVAVDIACIVVDNLIGMMAVAVAVAVDMNFDMVDVVGNFDVGNLAAVVLILNLEWIGEVAKDLAAVVVLLA